MACAENIAEKSSVRRAIQCDTNRVMICVTDDLRRERRREEQRLPRRARRQRAERRLDRRAEAHLEQLVRLFEHDAARTTVTL